MPLSQDPFFIDGDWSTFLPDGPPRVSNAFEGDAIFSGRDVVYVVDSPGTNWLNQVYERRPLGTFPNLQPWFPNQDSIIIEQEFRGNFGDFKPMRLNTPYDPGWALDWAGQFENGAPSVSLGNAILVKEGELEDCGGGIGKIFRRFATVPKSRTLVEQFAYNYIGLNTPATSRPRKTVVVSSRIQFDYFVFDDLSILGTPLFPDGNRLDVSTGINPPGLILQAQAYYGSDAFSEVDSLSDESSPGAGDATIPSFTEYLSFLDQTASGGLAAAEIIAEASCLRQWQGNIYERATRFVEAR